MKKNVGNFFGIGIIILISGLQLAGQDAQWRGPDRNGIYPDSGLLKQWPEDGPERLLIVENLGGGYSTPVRYNNRYYITGRRDSVEVITALSLEGSILWETEYGRAWMASFKETRNTPAIENGRIYIQGTMGSANCIDAGSGEILWSVNTHDQFDANFHRWGMAESVILHADHVMVSPVGEKTVMVALNKRDGSVAWKSEGLGDARSYVSPLLINHNGREILLATTSKHLVGIDPDNGEMLWNYDLVSGHTSRGRRNSTNTPLYHNGEIFISSGYDDEAIMFSLNQDGTEITVKWTSDVLDNHHHGLVQVDGYIYGSNWISNGKGNWVCLEWDTGRVLYETEWHNKGSVIYADGMLYVFEEKRGHVGLVKATPEGFDVISSFRIEEGRGPYWAHPSIYDGKLLLRHHDVFFVYEIKNN